MSIENIRIPPDSTGKRMYAGRFSEIRFDTGTVGFTLGDHVVGGITGTLGIVTKVNGTLSTGDIYVVPHLDEEMGNFVTGENLLVNSVIHARVASVTEIYVQNVTQVGASAPFNRQEIDVAGAAYVRFTEGSQQFDSFGTTKVSQATTLGDYSHDMHEDTEAYSTLTASGGSVSYLSAESAVILATDGTIGSRAQQTTNRYHHYFVGIGLLAAMTTACGDTGKAGNKRRWGYFDDSDGMFFQLNGTTLELVMRSSTTGSVVEDVVPQSEWNADRVDGTGPSLITLDITNVNIWWFDLQWLGSGRVRCGIFSPDGTRLVVHTMQHANMLPRAYMRSGSLPIRMENINTGVTGASSELRFQAATVKAEAALTPVFYNYACSGTPTGTVIGTDTPVASIRAATTFNSKPNRTFIKLDSISVFVSGGPVRCQIIENTVLTGATWPSVYGAAEVDRSATARSGGKSVKTVFLAPGSHIIDLSDVYDFTSDTLRLNADGTQTQNVCLVGNMVDLTVPTMFVSFNWGQLS